MYKMILSRVIPAITAMTGATLASSAAFLTNPIVLIVAAVIALTVGLTILYFKWKRFHDAVNAFFGLLDTNWRFLLFALPMIGPLLQAVSLVRTLIHWIERLIELVKHPLRINFSIHGPGDIFKKAKDFFSFINPTSHIPFADKLNPFHYIHLAQGGTATRGGLAVVGERGPELRYLPQGASVIPLKTPMGSFTLQTELLAPIIVKLDSRKLAESVARYRIKVQATQ